MQCFAIRLGDAQPDIAPICRPIAFTDGIPNVAGLPHDDIVIDGELYMRRYFLERSEARSVRFHEILRSDAGRDLHDHPWDFTSLVLAGRYIETTIDGDTPYEAPTVLYRSAETLHLLTLPDGPVWTYVVTGPVRRKWGFQTARGWVHWKDYDQLAALQAAR